MYDMLFMYLCIERYIDIWVGKEETALNCRYYDCICRKLKGRYREIIGIKRNLANFPGYIKIHRIIFPIRQQHIE